MGEPNTRKVIYEAQRQSRGGDVPPQARPWRRRIIYSAGILITVGLGVAGFFIWHALTYVTTNRASVCGAVLNLSSDTDARVEQLLVRPGQTVTSGQALVKLDSTEARAALAAAEAARAIADAHVAIAKADYDLRAARLPDEIRRAEAERAEAEASLSQIRKGARPEAIEAAKTRVASAKAQCELYAADLAHSEELIKNGYESRYELEVRKTRLLTQQNTVKEADLELARMIAGPTAEQVKVAEQALAAREAVLALARSGDKQLESMKAALAARQAELLRAEADVARCKAVADRMVITSPVSGTVIRTFVHEGELCRRTSAAVLVSDDAAGRWFEGLVYEQDAQALKVGQAARVEMVLGSGDYVDATVEAVALATSSLSRSENDPLGANRSIGGAEMVWVKLRPIDLKGSPLPGMSAQATIRVR